jgi:hypothetical protein
MNRGEIWVVATFVKDYNKIPKCFFFVIDEVFTFFQNNKSIFNSTNLSF